MTEPVTAFSFTALEAATGGFSAACRIGAGGSGDVYRGALSGVPVAIKLLRLPVNVSAVKARRAAERRFQKELQTLVRFRHPRVVQLLGCAIDHRPGAEYPFGLVMELLEAGSLADFLLPPAAPDGAGAAAGPDADAAAAAAAANVKPLPPAQRIDIAMGAACGLAFLHGLKEQAEGGPAAAGAPAAGAGRAAGAAAASAVLHRDVKSANVSEPSQTLTALF